MSINSKDMPSIGNVFSLRHDFFSVLWLGCKFANVIGSCTDFTIKFKAIATVFVSIVAFFCIFVANNF